MLQKHLYILFLIINGVLCFGQTATISGNLKDSEGIVISDVQIAVLEDGSISTASDNNGNYSINVPANKTITLSFYSISYIQLNKKYIKSWRKNKL